MQNKARRIFLWIASLSAATAMAGCAMMSESQCANANWYELGRRDSLDGDYIFSSREKACTKHGMGADRSAYDRGVQTGLVSFCTAASGRQYGANGGVYSRGFCPANTEGAFLSGYTPAREKYEYQKKLKNLRSRIADKNEALGSALRQAVRNEREIEGLRSEIKGLNQELQMELLMRVLD